MGAIAKFEKVSFGQFTKDIRGYNHCLTEQEIRDMYDRIQLPRRATTGSAGYDFKAPFTFALRPGRGIRIPTGIRAIIPDGWFLMCVPRSSLGFRYRLQCDNTVCIIDRDYYKSDNEGHIFVQLTNDNHCDSHLCIGQGDAFLQGIFLPYGLTCDDDTTVSRNGGIGSTDQKQEHDNH